MKKISIIGLGFVGMPTFLTLSNIKNKSKYTYEVEGIEKPDSRGEQIKKDFNKKKNWIPTKDKIFKKYFNIASKRKEVYINTNLNSLFKSNVVIVSVNFDFQSQTYNYFKNLKKLSKDIASKIKKKTLVIFETTLPPGTTDKIIIPEFKKSLKERKMKIDDIYLCYSFERVMPGENYINSIISNYRCFSGINDISKKSCKKFLKSFINHRSFKLTEFDKIIECETAKILENSYRASNIAFIDEWTKASKTLKINLNKVIEAIKLRPTHSNMMWPGLGVGGYCLTKDPSFIQFTFKNFFKKKNTFPIIRNTLKINDKMVNTSFDLIKNNVGLNRKNILICGVSYKENTPDLRFSPSLKLIKILKSKNSKISILDPYHNTSNGNLKKVKFIKTLNKRYDIIIFCVKHKEFKKINFLRSELSKQVIIFDLNRVLSLKQKKLLIQKKIKFYQLGSYS